VTAFELISGEGFELIAGADFEVSSLVYDSRKAAPSSLFFALMGSASDGKLFAQEAADRGAGGIVFEGDAPELETAATLIQVADARRALARASHRFFGEPTQDLVTLGLTGTDGKTTTAYLIESVFSAAGIAIARFGTVEHSVCGKTYPALNTTPESSDLVALFAEARGLGAKAVVFEVSSHALVQKRADFCQFDGAVFTGLGRDHLDYHETVESYFQAKRRLFVELLNDSPKRDRFAVVNLESDWGRTIFDDVSALGLRAVGVGGGGDLFWVSFEADVRGVRGILSVSGEELRVASPLLGDFNAVNIALACAAAHGCGIPMDSIANGISALECVPGRMEPVRGDDVLVLVDYAHTPDALAKAIGAARRIASGRLTVVFGCGGDRDRGKRPLMGEVAGELADRVVVTSDNPRTEDPMKIIEEIESGMSSGKRVSAADFGGQLGGAYCVVPNREEAIDVAIATSTGGEVVLIAGKGHEPYQILGTERVPFDDREKAREALVRHGLA